MHLFLWKPISHYSFEAFEIDLVIFHFAPECSTFIHLRSKERFCVCLFCLQSLCRDSILLYHSCEGKGMFFHLASGRWVWKVLKVKATKWVVKKPKIYDKLSAFSLLRGRRLLKVLHFHYNFKHNFTSIYNVHHSYRHSTKQNT